MHRRNRFASWSLLAFSLSLVSLAGCGATERGLVPVSGRITLDGGPWPKPGKITFLPVADTGENLRPASADFAPDGGFTVSSFDGAEGLYPGEYQVSVECWESEPGMMKADEAKKAAASKKAAGGPTSGKSLVPQKYQSTATSEFKLKVEVGKKPDANFDVKSS